MDSQCRLTVVGKKYEVRRFQNRAWDKILAARYGEPLEFSPRRFVCQFTMDDPGLERLQHLSREHPALVLFLEYDTGRSKGLARAKAGEIIQHRIRY